MFRFPSANQAGRSDLGDRVYLHEEKQNSSKATVDRRRICIHCRTKECCIRKPFQKSSPRRVHRPIHLRQDQHRTSDCQIQGAVEEQQVNSLSFSSIPEMMSRILGVTMGKEKTAQVASSPVKPAVHCHCCRRRKADKQGITARGASQRARNTTT